LAQPTYGAFLLKRNHITGVDLHYLSQLKPPYLVVGNHAHTLDSFFVSAALPVHVRWVAGAYLFKLFGLRPLLERWVGAISKQQGRSDLFTIRAISDALKQGDIVALFPEGTRTWDGEPVGFDEAIAKLIRMFKVPVVVLNLEGFYGLKPRWSEKRRKGNAYLRCLPPLYPDQISQMTISQLYARLQQDIGFSYRKWQEQNHIPYQSTHAAEGLEQVLYLCPDCHGVSTMKTQGTKITCSSCNFTMELDQYDRLHLLDGKHPLEDVANWHAWEQSYMTGPEGTTLTFPPDEGVLFQTGDYTKLIVLAKRFRLSMEKGGMQVTLPDNTFQYFPFDAIQSMIINAKNTVELYHNNTLYRIRIQKRGSILKYVEMYQTKRKTLQGGTL
jgi:1-acyl-sn-glycerol-3-phosphate acyltransferase